MSTFEITIQRKDEGAWPVVVRHQPTAQALARWSRGRLELDLGHLDALRPTQKEYGTLLGQALFREEIRDSFVRAAAGDEPLRVLLIVEADDLRGLHWEQLHAPLDRGWDYLLLNQPTPFSLYLPSQIERRFPPFGRRDLRALILVAGPEELEDERLSLDPFDVAGTVEGLQQALGDIPCDVLAPLAGASGPPRLDALCERITARTDAEAYTLLHIVCHGAYQRDTGETILFFPQDEGLRPVTASTLIEHLGRLGRLPHLTFLSTCESADPVAEAGLGGLGQRLVRELGMPAVVAMTDRISIATAQALASTFYARLAEHGEVDRALGQALAGLQGRPDVTVPALFSRLGGRSLWTDALDRPLTAAEIGDGLDQMVALLEKRAPVLQPEFEGLADTLRASLGTDPAALSAEARREREAALAAANQLCSQALDLSFHALALGQPPPAYDGRCPFRGLFPFRAEDREFFFGRQALVDKLSGRLMDHGFLAVLGPSGSGKSSLVLAGLVPALQARFPRLRMAYLTPGSEPLAQLEAALSGASDGEDRPNLIVVDQFEELFTLCRHEGERQAFVDRLLALSANTALVLTLRADFWGECAAFPALKDEMQAHQELVGPMDASALRRAMERQADHVGLRFEAGLGEEILDDVAGEPGAMPLLQHALLLLWQRRHGRWLRWEEYQAIGGIRQAIAHTADEVYLGLAGHEQARMRDIFLRLTRLEDEAGGAEVRDTRRRVGLAELVPAGSEPADTIALAKRLADARLVVTSLNAASGQEEIEVAHEALIRHWPRLRGWLDEDRAELRLREGVREAALDWQANDQEEAYLVHRGGRLEDAEALRRQPRFTLNEMEQAYVEACVALRERERREKEEQQRRELEAARKLAAEQQARAEEQAASAARMRRRAAVIGAVGIVAILLAVLSVVLWRQAQANATDAINQRGTATANLALAVINEAEANNQKGTAQANEVEANNQKGTAQANEVEANNQRATAEANAQVARSRELAASAVEQMPADAELGRLLAVEAASSAHTSEAERALRKGILNPLRTVLRGHSLGVFEPVYSPDGKWLASPSSDRTVRVWDTATWKTVRTLPAGAGYAADPIFSTDSRVVAVSDTGGRRAWDTRTWQEVPVPATLGEKRPEPQLPLGPGEVLVAFSQEGTLALTVDEGGNARVRKVETGEVLSQLDAVQLMLAHTFSAQTRGIFSPDGSLVLTHSILDNTAYLWQTATGNGVRALEGHTGPIADYKFSPDGQLVATGADFPDNGVRVWSVEPVHYRAQSQSVADLHGHASWINSIIFSEDGRLIISSSDDGTMRVWEPKVGQDRQWSYHIGETPYSPYRMSFSSDGELLAVAGGAVAQVFDAETGNAIAQLGSDASDATSVAFSPDGALVVTGYADGRARLLEARSGKLLQELGGDGAPINDAQFSPDGSRVVTASEDNTARLWHTATGQLATELQGHTGPVRTAAFSPDGALVVTASDDGTSRVWDTASGRLVWELGEPGGHNSGTEFSGDGTWVVTAGFSPLAQVWDVQDGSLVADLIGHQGELYMASFSPDGKYVVTASADYSSKIYEIATGRPVQELLGHVDRVRVARYSPDGRFVLTGSEDNTVWLWDAETGEKLITFRGHPNDVTDARFSPDGRLIASVSTDGTLQVFRCEICGGIEELVRLAQARVYRDLTCEERQRYLHETGVCP